MKKFVTLMIAVFVIVSSAICANCEELDVASMSTDDLLAIYNTIQSELYSRIGMTDNNYVGQGIYVVGKDIKAGSYDFVCTESGSRDDGSQQNAVYIYLIGDDGVSQGKTLWYLYDTALNSKITLNLSEGTILEIWNCAGVLIEVDHSWKP